MNGKEVGYGPMCGRCLVISKIIQTDKGFYAVCAGCNISVHGETAGEADDRFAGKAMKYVHKRRTER